MHKILVVDDDKPLLGLLRHCMETEGYSTITAENGATALNWVKETRFDLAILDLCLPDSSGLEICEAIKKDPKTRATKVIILTGNTGNDNRIKSNLHAGADLFLTKPIEPNDLRQAARKMLEAARQNKLLLPR
jgi:CheY-like chemotaxis protein